MIVQSFIVLLCFGAVSGQKTIAVRGQLTCGGKPLPGANVTLGAERSYPRRDLVFATVQSDARGYFEIHGVSRNIRKLKAVVKVTHSCNFQGELTNSVACERTVTYNVPDEFAAKNTTKIQKWFQLDTPNMAYVQVNERGRC